MPSNILELLICPDGECGCGTGTGTSGCIGNCYFVAAADLTWSRLPTPPECEDESGCGCLTPDAAAECEGQIAVCICQSTLIEDDPEFPNCTYDTCLPEED